MLIAVSGSQGTGKSTTLAEMERQGYHTVHRKTSRSILQDWGVTLEEVNSNHDLTVRFQDEILARKIADEFAAKQSDDVWLTERTPIDLLVYATVTLGPFNKYNDWLDEYSQKCIIATNEIYEHVVYLPGGMFPIQHDGTRGASPLYGKLIDLAMEHLYRTQITKDKCSFLYTADLRLRCEEIDQIAHKITRRTTT
jgi:predicted ATPase